MHEVCVCPGVAVVSSGVHETQPLPSRDVGLRTSRAVFGGESHEVTQGKAPGQGSSFCLCYCAVKAERRSTQQMDLKK